MERGRRLTEQGKERKLELLDAAETLFATRGYGPTRIADICEAAGVAKGLFYWYFETKDALFAELVRSVRQRLRRAQAAAMDDAADPLTRIRQGAVASVRFMAEHMEFFALLEGQRSAGDVTAVLVESAEIYTADVERLIREAQQTGRLPDDTDPRLAAVGVLGTVSYFSQSLRAGRVEIEVDELARFVGEWVVRALGSDVATAVVIAQMSPRT
jgi:AcrR family transcriptional regulator